ncbi:energy transducer TonB [Uliginosibacterium sp. TH139]|uniref:energy transducer TonB n=1 Tax=Uliginosibacterium sp. TH139 TaxID=2067453 RepID=UPI001304589F|nr:TonB family protein [Uliginosibacterium sp. TH139]
MILESIYGHRDPAAVGGMLIVMAALFGAWQFMPPPPQLISARDETVITMEDLPLPPPPEAPPPPPKVEPPPETPQPVVKAVQPTPAPTPTPTPMPTPAPAAPSPTPVPTPQPPTPAPPPPPPPPQPVRAASASADQAYEANLRAYLESIKRYPNSREARQLRPTGVVKIWIEIDREGRLLDAGVETSSGTMLLDKEALRTVRNGRYQAFPGEAFTGQGMRRFAVPIEYVLEGTS